MPIEDSQARAIAAICLHAALADGGTTPQERDRLTRVFSTVDEQERSDVYQEVVMGGVAIESAVAELQDPAVRTMAYDMAVGVCEADGVTSETELAFLSKLKTLLAIDSAYASRTLKQGEAIASALDQPAAAGAATTAMTAPPVIAVGAGAAVASAVDPASAEVDGMVLRYAIVNAAIELLPQDLATVAILPMQMKMVYRVGKRHGHELSAGHIKEFLGVLGVGMTSQVLEGYARKLLGKMAGRALGKTAGKLASKATGSAMTFATTYALGMVAKRYYAGGRSLSGLDLKGLFQSSAERGKVLYEQHAPQVTQQASGLDMMKVMDLVRGKQAV